MIRSVLKLVFVVAGWSFVFPIISDASVCGVTAGFNDPEIAVSGLLVDIAYDPSAVQPVGVGDDVECVAHVGGVLATFNEIAEEAVVKAGLVRLDAFGGAALFTCVFTGDAVDATDLVFDVRDATGPDLEPVSPIPTVTASEIVCDGEPADGADPASPAGSGTEPVASGDDPVLDNCSLTVTAHSEAPVAGLMYDLHYSGAARPDGGSAVLVGSGDDVGCETLVDGALAAYHDDEDEDVLVAGIVHLEGFSGTIPVTRCRVETAGPVSVSDFDIVLTEGVGPDGGVLPAAPVLSLDLDCANGTDDDGAGDSGDGADDVPVAGSCEGPFDVTFAVDAATALSSLQFSIGYAGAPGEFDGLGDAVQCEALGDAAGGFSMYNDLEAESQLVAAYVSLSPFTTPSDVLRCRFTASGRAPQTADFVASGVEASDQGVNEVAAQISVSSIVPSADNDGCGVCGDGDVDAGEECDDGNQENQDACLQSCTWNECGDGYVDPEAEECDDANDSDGDACLSTCVEATCGDGHVREGIEDCDAGDINSDTHPDACRGDCTLPRCGDAVVDSGEECDDGNDDATDACLPDCVLARCGDGVVRETVETCDQGDANNDADPDACRNDCSLPDTCGDADGNGVITATDAKIVLDNAIGLVSTCSPSRCDVNGNTATTATDARMVLNAAARIEVDLGCWLPVLFTFDNEAVVGGLQFSVDYSATGSTFVGAGENVYCTTPESDDLLVSFNNDEGAGVLYAALVSTRGLETPSAVAACSFHQPAHDISPSDFVISISDAVDPEVEPIEDPHMSTLF